MLSLTLMLCILSRLPWDPVRTILSLFFSPCLQSLSLDNLRPMADDAERGARGKRKESDRWQMMPFEALATKTNARPSRVRCAPDMRTS